MKTLTLALPLFLMLAGSLCAQGARNASSAVGVSWRLHTEHGEFKDVPYQHDHSYGIVYEYHEPIALWQLGVHYLPSPSDRETDQIITPHINLLFKDGIWRGGMGILASYVKGREVSDWTDIYFQFVLGFEIPIASLRLGLSTYYVFDDFGSVQDFDFSDLDYGAHLTFPF